MMGSLSILYQQFWIQQNRLKKINENKLARLEGQTVSEKACKIRHDKWKVVPEVVGSLQLNHKQMERTADETGRSEVQTSEC